MSLFPHLVPVVYVDELEAGRNTFRSQFQDIFELFTCSDASLALQALENRPGSVLITHLRLHKAKALDFIAEVQLKFPSSQIILLHTEADTGFVEGSLLTAGLFRTLHAPYAVSVMRSIIERAYSLSWNTMHNGSIKQELDIHLSDRDLLCYKLETEVFAPLEQLKAICNAVEEHRDSAPASELAQFLGRRLSAITSGRMSFRALYRGSRVELLPETLNAFALLQDLKSSVCEVYGLSETQLNVEITVEGEWVGDCEKIRLILLELLNNAACSSDDVPDALNIGLSVQILPEVVNLEVVDNGRGIAIALHQRVFRMFERSATGNGNGMGLFIVRETVKQLGGDIRLKSEVGKGSAFQVRIPNLLSQKHQFAV